MARCINCGHKLRRDNKTGYCSGNLECRRIADRARARESYKRRAEQEGLAQELPEIHRPRGEIGTTHSPWEGPVSPLVIPAAKMTRDKAGGSVMEGDI